MLLMGTWMVPTVCNAQFGSLKGLAKKAKEKAQETVGNTGENLSGVTSGVSSATRGTAPWPMQSSNPVYNGKSTKQFLQEIAEECVEEMIPIDEVVYKTALSQIAKVVKRHLRNGDKVCLDGIGLLKLEIESDKVDNPSDFNPKKHIRGARVHFIPESIDGVQDLYDGIEYEREK